MYTILLVDDERMEREGLRFLIERGGYKLNVLEAANGEEALRLIEENTVNILVTDIRMPIMSGIELAEKIRQDDADMKILFSSAYGEFEYARDAIRFGATAYLLKPVAQAQFYQELEKAIGQLDQEYKRTRDIISGRYWYELETGKNDDDETLLSRLDSIRREIQAHIAKKDTVGANAQIEMFVSCLRALGRASLMYTRFMAMEVLNAMLEGDTSEARRKIMEEVSTATEPAQLAEIVERKQNEILNVARVGQADEDAVERIIHTIREKYHEPLTLESLAKSVYLAPSYVSYLFKRRTGSTLIKYITDYRMKKAAEMLEHGSQPVTLIAQCVGYDNSSYFSSVFRAHFGLSPADYRRKSHGEGNA